MTLQGNGVEPYIADRKIGDQHVRCIAYQNAMRHVAVLLDAHPPALDNNVIAFSGRTANGNVFEFAADVQGLGELVGPGREQYRRAVLQVFDRLLQLGFRLHLDYRSPGGR